MLLSKKVRLKPTLKQEVLFFKFAGIARWVYNWTLNRQNESYKQGEKFIFDFELIKEIIKLKNTDDFNWISEASSDLVTHAVIDACNAFRAFFKGFANYPRFKSRKNSRLSFYNPTKVRFKDKKAFIRKIGWVKISEHVPVGCKYSNPRITYDGKYWYLSVGIEQIQYDIQLTSEVIGIDVGIKNLAVCSNGITFKNINRTSKVRKIEKRLHRLQRSVSRKYEMNKVGNCFVKTNNIKKQEKEIRLLYRKLTNIRTNHLHQVSSQIVKTKPFVIVMEDLNIKGMIKNRYLSKAIAQQKLYEFKRQIQYKCEKYGISFVKVDKWYPSSKTCSGCGCVKKKLSLSERTYKCEECLLEIDRDLNASINLSRYQSVS